MNATNSPRTPILAATALATLLGVTAASAGPNPGPFESLAQQQRTPYSEDDVGECNDVNCFFEFAFVPEGYVLVLQHAGGVVRPDDVHDRRRRRWQRRERLVQRASQGSR